MKNIIILISGGGSNMAAIVHAAQQQQWERRWGVRVAAVISNKADAEGLVFAKNQGIATAANCATTNGQNGGTHSRCPAGRR